MRPALSRFASLILTTLAMVGLYAAAFSAETPVGALRCRVIADDTGRPLSGASVVVRPSAPKHGSDARDLTADGDGSAVVGHLPAGSYQVQTLSSVYQNRTVTVFVREGETAKTEIRLTPGAPFLNLEVHQRAYLPHENPKIALHGFRQGDSVRLRMYALDPEGLVAEHGKALREMLTPIPRSDRASVARALRSHGARVLRDWHHPVTKRDAEGVFYDYEQLGDMHPGLYLVEAQGNASRALGWVLVTDLALVTKSAAGRVLAFTVNLKTGVPEPNAQLTLYRGAATAARATTDGQGRADLHVAAGQADSFSVLARQGESLAFMDFNPAGYTYGANGPEQYRVFTYTDRPVYRPGHRVFFKGIVRHLEPVGYSVPSPREVRVQVQDDQQTTLYDDELALNDRGSFSGQFDLPSEAKGGLYSITAYVNGEQHADTFTVASYRKPEWRVDVSMPKRHYVRGETVPVSVSAQYYYGAPVGNAKVHYTVFRSRYPSFWAGEDDTDADEGGEAAALSGDVVANGDLTTAADGTTHFEFSTTATADEKQTSRFDFGGGMYQYTVEADVSDLSDREASGRGSVSVSAGEFALEAQGDHTVIKPGDSYTATLRAQDGERHPAAGVRVKAVASRDIWEAGRLSEKEITRQELTTDATGTARFTLTLNERGLITVRFSARDHRGNPIDTMTDVWVTSAEGGDYLRNYPALAVIPDRKHYRVGDTAQVLINTDKPGATAIVSLEAERVLDLQVVPLKSKSTVLRFPIRTGYEPNVFIAACFVMNREFITNRAGIQVNADSHKLKVEIDSDRAVYHPGDMATFHVRTRDATGKPVRAEVSLGVVDEAVYAIREESKRALWDAFYPRRRDEVVTEFAYPQIYMGDADKDGADISVRKKFPDTAFWNPVLETDASGRATVSFRLPDSLTSWRATASAVTLDTGVGRATYNVQVQKELTLRLETPRSLTEGDHLTVSAVVHNYTRSAQDVAVELKARGVKLAAGGKQTRRLNPDEAAKFSWEAVAGADGPAVFTALARAGSFTDGMELSVPVRPFARQEVLYRTGAVAGDTAREEWDRDPAAVAGEAEIRLAPTLAGAALSGLEYLATYPHGCTEQTMSSFLPDVVILRTLHDLGIRNAALQNRLPAMTQAGLLRLYRYQHEDGGWGWWENDDTDHWMTAYVLFGLTLGRESNVGVNERVYETAIGAAKRLASDEKLTADDAMFLAYALARAGARKSAHELLRRFGKETSKLQVRSAAYRVLALRETHDAEDRELAHAGMEYLWSAVDSSGGVAHWSEKRSTFSYGVPEDVESTAVVLKAALASDTGDPRLAGVVRWLLLKRQGNQWESTRDTAWILFALADYLKATGELHPDYELTVQLNGKELHSTHVSEADALDAETVLRVPFADLRAQNQLEVRAAGRGTAYYSVRFTQTVHAEGFAPETSVPGLTVTREYYRMESRKDSNGNPVVIPEKRPSRSFRVADRILVRLKLHADHTQEFLMLEEPLPAGCEVQERGELTRAEWTYWWAHQDVRDDRINFFVRRLEPGDHVIEYYVRPEAEGNVRALPTVLSDMYVPAVRASTGDSALEIGR